MNKTRLKILSVSRELFNKNGYSSVTIRMIALELKMSSGNLNYHFKKREHILEGLYFEMTEVFEARMNQLDRKDISLQTVKEDVLESLEQMIAYRFFWTDLYNLLKLNPKIKSHFEEAYRQRFKGYELLFKILVEKKVLRDFAFNAESSFLIERMIGFSNTWLYNSFIYELNINPVYIDAQAQNLLGMLYPYFTDNGKSEFKRLFPNFFE